MESLHETSGSDFDQLERLRSILLGPAFEELLTAVARFEDPEARARYVAEVLSEAIALRGKRGDSLPRALAQPVAAAVRASVETDPQPLVDAIFPVIGPAIRRSVSELMSSMMERVTTMVDQSFSPRGVRWRFEAWRSGVPFGEVVLRHTLRFRVEQVFWIHRETGLLLVHVAAGDRETQDPDMVSGMLTAIRDFLSDSFEAEGGDVRSMEMGDCRLVVRDGPTSSLAALVRGTPPSELSERLHETLEELHREHGPRLARFDGDVDPLAPAEPTLARCLMSQVDAPAPAPGRRLVLWLAAAGVVALLAGWAFQSHLRAARWERTLDALRGVPGLVVLDAARSQEGYRIEGLRDPLAELPVLDEPLDRPLRFAWRPFVSLEPDLVRARAQAALDPPPEVDLELRGEVLHVSGRAPLGWMQGLVAGPPAVPGVARLETAALVPDARREIAALQAMPVDFATGDTVLQEESARALRSAGRALRALGEAVAAFGWVPAVQVSGSADGRGEWERNLELAGERAAAVAAALEEADVPAAWIQQEARVSRSEADAARRAALAVRLVRRDAAGGAP